MTRHGGMPGTKQGWPRYGLRSAATVSSHGRSADAPPLGYFSMRQTVRSAALTVISPGSTAIGAPAAAMR